MRSLSRDWASRVYYFGNKLANENENENENDLLMLTVQLSNIQNK